MNTRGLQLSLKVKDLNKTLLSAMAFAINLYKRKVSVSERET
jgi:hypothetical protein